jgi:hypothetical protein
MLVVVVQVWDWLEGKQECMPLALLCSAFCPTPHKTLLCSFVFPSFFGPLPGKTQ